MSPSFHSHHLKTLQQMLESGPDAILLVSASGKIFFANTAVEKLFGYTREEILGKDLELLLPEALRKKHEQMREHYMANPTPRRMGSGLSLNGLRKDGSLLPVDIALSHFKMNEEPMTSCWIRDDSTRRLQERKREKLLTELEETLKKFQSMKRLLPICAKCKKVRNSQQDWISVENFMQEHAKTEFTHGLCPECLKEFMKPFS